MHSEHVCRMRANRTFRARMRASKKAEMAASITPRERNSAPEFPEAARPSRVDTRHPPARIASLHRNAAIGGRGRHRAHLRVGVCRGYGKVYAQHTLPPVGQWKLMLFLDIKGSLIKTC